MSAGFGFSTGDIIACLKLIKDSIDAVQDGKGAVAEYQSLIHEVDSLRDGLQALQELDLEAQLGANSKQYAAVQDAVSRCQCCIETFMTSISKYQPWLQLKPATVPALWKSNLRKIRWALCKKDDISRFRAQLERHGSSINMLLLAIQV